MSAISIGCDPELFAKDVNGDFISAHGIIPGTKVEPHKVPLGAVQVDGMAFEFNTDPAMTRDDFIRNVQGVMRHLESMIPANLSLSPGTPVAHFKPEVFKKQPLEALELGCEPDYSAYTGFANPRPDAHGKAMRTAAGHIHIGFTGVENPFDDMHMFECRELTKLLDVFVGLPSLFYDNDTERRTLYGAAGAFRPKTYGLEYRVLSNAWLRSPELMGEVYDEVTNTTEIFLQGAMLAPDMYTTAAGIISTGDVRAARTLLQQAKQQLGLE